MSKVRFMQTENGPFAFELTKALRAKGIHVEVAVYMDALSWSPTERFDFLVDQAVADDPELVRLIEETVAEFSAENPIPALVWKP